MPQSDTKAKIIQAADDLFYAQGYEATSFADIADAVGISRGNFYYHFKTKDEILDAVIAHRLAGTQDMIDAWDTTSETPLDKIKSFVRILLDHRDAIMQHGCPVGTLTSELAKLNHAAQSDANALFTLFRVWLRKAFTAISGKKDADAHALHVLAFTQGVATLANAFHDERFIKTEVARMEAWLDQLAKDTI